VRIILTIQYEPEELVTIHRGFELAGILEEHGDSEAQFWILGIRADSERIDGEPAAIFDPRASAKSGHALATRFLGGAYPVGVVMVARRALSVLLDQASKRAADPLGGYTPDYMERCAKQVPLISDALRTVDASLEVVDRMVQALPGEQGEVEREP
jgi:hypothetical protein